MIFFFCCHDSMRLFNSKFSIKMLFLGKFSKFLFWFSNHYESKTLQNSHFLHISSLIRPQIIVLLNFLDNLRFWAKILNLEILISKFSAVKSSKAGLTTIKTTSGSSSSYELSNDISFIKITPILIELAGQQFLVSILKQVKFPKKMQMSQPVHAQTLCDEQRQCVLLWLLSDRYHRHFVQVLEFSIFVKARSIAFSARFNFKTAW